MKLKNFSILHVVVIVLIIGFVIRLSDLSSAVAEDDKSKSGEVVVSENKGAKVVDLEAKEDGAPIDAKKPAEEKNMADDLSNANITVLKQLSERRRELDTRENELDKREALLKAAQVELGEKYKELATLRNEIKTLLGQQEEEEEARLVSLVKVYEGMKPKEAAGILNTLDLEILLQVMGRMSERKLSPILAQMDPERAREVTINLATQKKLPDAVTQSGN